MDRSDVIYLIAENWQQNEYGVEEPVQTEKKVYAAVRSVTGNEIAEFGRNGISPEFRFDVFRYDYNGEKLVRYKNRVYSVYRGYIGQSDVMELYCELRGGTA